MLDVWPVSSDSKELPRDRVPGTERKFECVSGAFVLGDEMLWGEVGRLSRSRASEEALERIEAVDRISVGEPLPLFSSAVVSGACALSV